MHKYLAVEDPSAKPKGPHIEGDLVASADTREELEAQLRQEIPSLLMDADARLSELPGWSSGNVYICKVERVCRQVPMMALQGALVDVEQEG